MATITKGKTFTSGETVTPTKLNDLVDNATIAFVTADDTDDSTLEASAGKLRAKDAGITAAKLADGAVTGAAGGGKVAASAITGQTQLTDPLAAGDEFLVHDTSASALRRVAWSNVARSGSVVQIQTSTDAKVGVYSATPNAFIPADDTAPQISEGVEIGTVSITPVYSDSKIIVEARIPGATGNSNGGRVIAALFRDAATSAVASSWRYATNGGYDGELGIKAVFPANAASLTTFYLRVSYSQNVSVHINGDYSTFGMGNTMSVYLSATEIKA